jgi:hypothetical protein
MEAAEIHARVRRMVETGELPCAEPGKVWAGHGSGTHCAACGGVIACTEVEYETPLLPGLGLRLHRECYYIWLEECGPQARARA